MDYKELLNRDILLFILEHIHEAVHITDKTGKIIYVNKGAEILEYLPKDEMVGYTASEIFTFTDYDKGEITPSLNVLKTGIPRLDENCEYYTKNRKAVNSIVSNYPYFSEKETPDMVISVSENIKEMRERLITIGGLGRKIQQRIRVKLLKNGTSYIFEDIIGESQGIHNAKAMARRFANKKMPIMIYGETGTGKEMFAQSIHNASPYMNGKFVPINCAAIPENLLESILFGTVKGAFTGALDKAGLFEKAENGTLFLDEINSMPILLQAKLLRALQEKEVQRIGDSKSIKINCRIISATNKLPFEAIRSREMREDLFYRLSTGLVYIPPLREREGDLNLLLQFFIEQCNEDLDINVIEATELFKSLLNGYSWPGNIRELANIVESSMNMTQSDDEKLSVQHLPSYIKKRFEDDILSESDNYLYTEDLLEKDASSSFDFNDSLKKMVWNYEKKLIERALEIYEGNVSKISDKMGLSRQALDKKIKKYQISVDNYRNRKISTSIIK